MLDPGALPILRLGYALLLRIAVALALVECEARPRFS